MDTIRVSYSRSVEEMSPRGRNAHQVPLKLGSQSCGFKVMIDTVFTVTSLNTFSIVPHYQHAKGQSLLLREDSSHVAFFSEDSILSVAPANSGHTC